MDSDIHDRRRLEDPQSMIDWMHETVPLIVESLLVTGLPKMRRKGRWR